jgi:BNR/Asp-box repeat protein
VRVPPRVTLALVATLSSIAALGGVTPARAGAGAPVNRAYEHKLRLEAARDAAMANRQRPAVALPTAPGGRAPSIFDTPRDVQQISQDTLHQGERDTQVEPDIAMDPNDANDIVSVVQQGRFETGGSADPGFATSLDGGHSWTSGNLPGLTKAVGGAFDRGSDATVAFGPDHVAYASTIDFSFRQDCPSGVGVNVSADGGLTWSDAVFPQDDADCDVFSDKNWLVVDTNAASPFFGRVYLVWTLFTPTAGTGVLRYSDDGGQTWSDLIDVTSPPDEVEGLLPLVQSNGNLTIVYDDVVGGGDFEVAQTSTDGGLTFGVPVTIAEFLGAGDPGLRTGGLPAAAIDPTNDAMYVVWQDTRFRSDGHNDTVISESTDGGATWSSPARVNGPDPNGQILDHFSPDVAAHSGVVHVTYRTRDFAGKHASEFVDQRYIVSADGGATFGGELILGPPTDLKYAAAVTGGRAFLGDYFGVVANADVAHAAWTVALYEKKGRFNQTLWSGTIDR